MDINQKHPALPLSWERFRESRPGEAIGFDQAKTNHGHYMRRDKDVGRAYYYKGSAPHPVGRPVYLDADANASSTYDEGKHEHMHAAAGDIAQTHHVIQHFGLSPKEVQAMHHAFGANSLHRFIGKHPDHVRGELDRAIAHRAATVPEDDVIKSEDAQPLKPLEWIAHQQGVSPWSTAQGGAGNAIWLAHNSPIRPHHGYHQAHDGKHALAVNTSSGSLHLGFHDSFDAAKLVAGKAHAARHYKLTNAQEDALDYAHPDKGATYLYHLHPDAAQHEIKRAVEYHEASGLKKSEDDNIAHKLEWKNPAGRPTTQGESMAEAETPHGLYRHWPTYKYGKEMAGTMYYHPRLEGASFGSADAGKGYQWNNLPAGLRDRKAHEHHVQTTHKLSEDDLMAARTTWPGQGLSRFIGQHPGMVDKEMERAKGELNKSEEKHKSPALPIRWEKGNSTVGHTLHGLYYIQPNRNQTVYTPWHGSSEHDNPYINSEGGEFHSADVPNRPTPIPGHGTVQEAMRAAEHHHAATHYRLTPEDVAATHAAWPDEGPRRFIGKHPVNVAQDLERAHGMNKSDDDLDTRRDLKTKMHSTWNDYDTAWHARHGLKQGTDHERHDGTFNTPQAEALGDALRHASTAHDAALGAYASHEAKLTGGDEFKIRSDALDATSQAGNASCPGCAKYLLRKSDEDDWTKRAELKANIHSAFNALDAHFHEARGWKQGEAEHRNVDFQDIKPGAWTHAHAVQVAKEALSAHDEKMTGVANSSGQDEYAAAEAASNQRCPGCKKYFLAKSDEDFDIRRQLKTNIHQAFNDLDTHWHASRGFKIGDASHKIRTVASTPDSHDKYEDAKTSLDTAKEALSAHDEKMTGEPSTSGHDEAMAAEAASYHRCPGCGEAFAKSYGPLVLDLAKAAKNVTTLAPIPKNEAQGLAMAGEVKHALDAKQSRTQPSTPKGAVTSLDADSEAKIRARGELYHFDPEATIHGTKVTNRQLRNNRTPLQTSNGRGGPPVSRATFRGTPRPSDPLNVGTTGFYDSTIRAFTGRPSQGRLRNTVEPNLPGGHDRSHPDAVGTNAGGIPGDTVEKGAIKRLAVAAGAAAMMAAPHVTSSPTKEPAPAKIEATPKTTTTFRSVTTRDPAKPTHRVIEIHSPLKLDLNGAMSQAATVSGPIGLAKSEALKPVQPLEWKACEAYGSSSQCIQAHGATHEYHQWPEWEPDGKPRTMVATAHPKGERMGQNNVTTLVSSAHGITKKDEALTLANEHNIISHHGLQPHEVAAVKKAWPEGVHRFMGKHQVNVQMDVARAVGEINKSEAKDFGQSKDLEWEDLERWNDGLGLGEHRATVHPKTHKSTNSWDTIPDGVYHIKSKSPTNSSSDLEHSVSHKEFTPGGGSYPWSSLKGSKHGWSDDHPNLDSAKAAALAHHVARHYKLTPQQIEATKKAWPDEGVARFHGKHPEMVRTDLDRAMSAMNKSVSDLTKMAIKDIPAGKSLGKEGKMINPKNEPNRYDYSHVLQPEHRDAGYTLTVSHHNPDFLNAEVLHNDEFAGSIQSNSDPKKKELFIGNAEVRPEHQGMGLGAALYEATMAHASKKLGAKRVMGGDHSSMAHKTHEALSAKHGMDYRAKRKYSTEPAGPYDGHYGKYDYTIKSDEPNNGKIK